MGILLVCTSILCASSLQHVHNKTQGFALWCSAGDYKVNLIPSLIGPFLEVTLVPQPDLRNVLIPVFHDMMDSEERRSGNFKQVMTSLHPCSQWRHERTIQRTRLRLGNRLVKSNQWSTLYPEIVQNQKFMQTCARFLGIIKGFIV